MSFLPPPRARRPLGGALLSCALAALGLASPALADRSPDAEIFATSNTALISDSDDPRLQNRLERFGREVEQIVREGGGKPRGSRLLDGVFFSSDIGGTTFERSRGFDVDDVSDAELQTIAETIGARFLQQSVLTFDRLPAGDAGVDAIELEVPGVSAQALRDGLLADQDARERLFGGSVTLDGHLILVADLADAALARAFAERIGGDVSRAVTRHGDREFVEPPAPPLAEIRDKTLRVSGSSADDRLALRATADTLEVDAGDDGSTEFEAPRGAFRRIRVVAGAGQDVLRFSPGGGPLDVSADEGEVRVDGRLPLLAGGVERLDIAGAGRVTVGDLTGTDLQELHGDFDTTELKGTRGRDFVDVLGSGGDVFVIGLPVFVQIEDAGPADELRIDGRAGDDQLSGSSLAADAIRLVLDGGDGDNVLFGGAGDDLLIGGDGFDDAEGNKGDDVARLGAYFDRFSWAPGDGNDSVDGQGSHDSLFFLGTAAAERFDLTADGGGARLRRDVDGVDMKLQRIEEIVGLAQGGADVFAIGDLTGTSVDLVDVNLGVGSPTGDGQPDRVLVAGTPGDDTITVAGSRGTARATGLPATVNITHAEVALDTLAIDTGAGDDSVDSSGLAPDTIALTTAP